MPVDTDQTTPVLVHLNPDDWRAFKRLKGSRKASKALRSMIGEQLVSAGIPSQVKR
jgi:hypothetical protein